MKKSKLIPIFLFLFLVIFILVSTPKKDVVYPYTLMISSGDTLYSVSEELEKEGIVRHGDLLRAFVVFFGKDKYLQTGEYLFERPLYVWQVAEYISGNGHLQNQVKITFPEGYTIDDMADAIETYLPSINKDDFISLYEDKEGYLFPDTYFFWPSSNAAEIGEIMMDNFNQKTKDLFAAYTGDMTQEDIVILASIIEKESSGDKDRYIISGILHNRLDKGMLLQVDATLTYVLGKSSKELTLSDLKIDSPYNTYVYKGLPPRAIANPGFASIEAAMYPENTPYYFYLHDSEGNTYYAVDHDGHVNNKNKHLR